MARQQPCKLFRDKLAKHPLTLEDLVLAEKDLARERKRKAISQDSHIAALHTRGKEERFEYAGRFFRAPWPTCYLAPFNRATA
jgi:hypothetical protein